MATNGAPEGRSVSEIRETGENKKVTFPTGGGYSPFIFRLISIQDGKKLGVPKTVLRASWRKSPRGLWMRPSLRNAIIRSTTRKSISAASPYQSRITPKPSSCVRSHRSTRSQILSSGEERLLRWRMPCWAIFGRRKRGSKGARRRGWLSKVGNACLEKRWAYWPVCRGESVSARKLCWEKHQF